MCPELGKRQGLGGLTPPGPFGILCLSGADVAQLAEQLNRNQPVVRSSRTVGSIESPLGSLSCELLAPTAVSVWTMPCLTAGRARRVREDGEGPRVYYCASAGAAADHWVPGGRQSG